MRLPLSRTFQAEQTEQEQRATAHKGLKDSLEKLLRDVVETPLLKVFKDVEMWCSGHALMVNLALV